MRNLPRPMRMGAVGTTESGTESTAETGAMGVAGATAKGIPTSAVTPSPSKVSAKHGNRHTNKGRLQQRGDASTYV